MRAFQALHRPVEALAPLLLIGCSRVEHVLSAVGCGVALILVSSLLGFIVSCYYCDRIYHFWQNIVTAEHQGDIQRLTDAATAMARDAERATRTAEHALVDLRARISALTREHGKERPWQL